MLALVAAALLYAPTLGYGLVNHDDTWLVRDNFLLKEWSTSTLYKVLFDTSAATRFVLGAEYLPVRDLTILADNAVWGTWYGGFHLTNLVIYLLSLIAWFHALVELGVDRRLAGLAVLLWAVMPAHAESIAWVSERKGLLGMLFAGSGTFGYAKFRAGGRASWLAIAAVSAVLAVWSKAPSAFAIATLAPIELAFGVRRRSWRRALIGLGIVGLGGLLAFAPVVITASNLDVVGTQDNAPAGFLAMPIGLHGFYLRDALMSFPNAVSYPISSLGPSTMDLVIGGVALVIAIAVLAWPGRGTWAVSPVVRVGILIWIVGFIPASRIGLPLRAVLVADRYILFATLGIAVIVAFGLLAVANARLRNTLACVIVIAAFVRSLDARSNWRDNLTLWHRATVSNPHDGGAWSAYIDQLLEDGQNKEAMQALHEGLEHTRAPRLVLRAALIALDFGDQEKGLELMTEAAHGGEPRAMANLALLLVRVGRGDEGLTWARKAVQTAPMYSRGYRTLGEVALAQRKPVEAMLALERAHVLSPVDLPTRYALALALIELQQQQAARPHLEACVGDPKVGKDCSTKLRQLRR